MMVFMETHGRKKIKFGIVDLIDNYQTNHLLQRSLKIILLLKNFVQILKEYIIIYFLCKLVRHLEKLVAFALGWLHILKGIKVAKNLLPRMLKQVYCGFYILIYSSFRFVELKAKD
jgi:hypothetical protein